MTYSPMTASFHDGFLAECFLTSKHEFFFYDVRAVLHSSRYNRGGVVNGYAKFCVNYLRFLSVKCSTEGLSENDVNIKKY